MNLRRIILAPHNNNSNSNNHNHNHNHNRNAKVPRKPDKSDYLHKCLISQPSSTWLLLNHHNRPTEGTSGRPHGVWEGSHSCRACG